MSAFRFSEREVSTQTCQPGSPCQPFNDATGLGGYSPRPGGLGILTAKEGGFGHQERLIISLFQFAWRYRHIQAALRHKDFSPREERPSPIGGAPQPHISRALQYVEACPHRC